MKNQSDTVLPKEITDSMAKVIECSKCITLSSSVLSNMIITLKHARTFITSKQKMHLTGIELYDELIIFLEGLGKEEI